MFDVSGVEIIPGNRGENCPGNGKHYDEQGDLIECCCDECDYLMCCISATLTTCTSCKDDKCPRAHKMNK